MKQYEKCNEAVAREYLHRRDGILFRDEISPKGDTEGEKYSSEELVLICGKLLELEHTKMESQLDDMKKSLARAKRPLIKKIIQKIYHIFTSQNSKAAECL